MSEVGRVKVRELSKQRAPQVGLLVAFVLGALVGGADSLDDVAFFPGSSSRREPKER